MILLTHVENNALLLQSRRCWAAANTVLKGGEFTADSSDYDRKMRMYLLEMCVIFPHTHTCPLQYPTGPGAACAPHELKAG